MTLQYCTEIVCDGITKYIEKHYLMVTGKQPIRIDTLPMLYYALSWNAPCRGGPPCPFFYPHGDSLTTWDSSVGRYRPLFMTKEDNTITFVRNP